MLRITNSQLQAIARAVQLDEFDDSMVSHLQTFAPNDGAALGEAGLRRVCKLAVERAANRGIIDVGLVRFYIELGFMFGSYFDCDPLLPWVGEIIGDTRTPDSHERCIRLYEWLCRYLPSVLGPGRSFAVACLRNLRARNFSALNTADSLERRILETLAHAYPQRCAYMGDVTFGQLFKRATAKAASFQWDNDHGIALVAFAMFVLGHGFDRDPLYPWAAKALADVSNPERELMRELNMYVDRTLHYVDQRQ